VRTAAGQGSASRWPGLIARASPWLVSQDRRKILIADTIGDTLPEGVREFA
jgi:hypothetical protein